MSDDMPEKLQIKKNSTRTGYPIYQHVAKVPYDAEYLHAEKTRQRLMDELTKHIKAEQKTTESSVHKQELNNIKCEILSSFKDILNEVLGE